MTSGSDRPSGSGPQQSTPMPDHSTARTAYLVSPTMPMRMTFDDPCDGTELVRVVKGTDGSSTTEVRFEPPTPNETLTGQPTSWCNAPTAGQPLVFKVPVPKPGMPDTVGSLQVTQRQAGITVRIPIRVKHAE